MTAYHSHTDVMKPGLASCGLLLLAWLAIYWPWLSGVVTVPWDGKAHFAPQVQFLAASIHSGQWPWWTPHIFAGHPQIADPQSMIFSPPMLLLAALDATPGPVAIDRAVISTALFGGLGMLAWGRLSSWHWAAAVIAAIIFMFGGSMAWRLQHFGQVMSLAYVPWTFVAIAYATRNGSVLAGLAAGLLGACVILGRDQVGLIAIYGLALFALIEFARAIMRQHRVARATLALGAGAIAGLAVVAIPLILTVLLSTQSNRPEIELASAQAGSLHPALLATIVAPNLYGSAGEMAKFWGPPSFAWENTGLFTAQNMGVVYLSALGLAVLIYGAARGYILERGCLFFLVSAVVTLAYALGWFTPVFAVIHDHIPGIDKFRRPADATFLIGGALAFVIGHSLTRALQDAVAANETGCRIEHRKAIATTILGVAALIIIAIVIAIWRDRVGMAAPEIGLALLWFGLTAATVTLAVWLYPIRPFAAGVALITVVTADVAMNNGPNGASALPTETIDMLDPARPHTTIATLRTQLAAANARDITRRDRFELYGLGYHWPNASLTHGLPNALGTNPVRLDWYARATGAGDTVATVAQRKLPPLMRSYDQPFARMLGLRYVLLPSAADQVPPPGALRRVSESKGHALYELPEPLPRVLFATAARAIDFDTAIRTGELPDADFRTTVLLEQTDLDEPRETSPTSRSLSVSRANITRAEFQNTRVAIELTNIEPGWLVLHDTWHPWWTVTVNDERRSLLRANIVFRAVRLAPGQNRVVFTFRPISGALETRRGDDHRMQIQ